MHRFMLRYFIVWLSMCVVFECMAQQVETVTLRETKVISYRDAKPLLSLPSSVSVVDAQQLSLQNVGSLVPAMNAVPGVKMDERSPGSYRLSIRGSLLRSPFGVRNVKIYLDEFPLTDAGGNTYLNLIDPNVIRQLEIVKGPEASLYGASTGGAVLMNTVAPNGDSTLSSVRIVGGSFGLFHQNALVQKKWKRFFVNVSQAWQRSDGYRENSSMKRLYTHAMLQWNYAERSHLKLFAFYSDLDYRTPGGLTLAQYRDDPSQARRPTSFLPGAVEQRAGVTNKTWFGGLTNTTRLGGNVKFVATLFASQTHFENPFVTNFETRDEQTVGLRSFVDIGLVESKIATLNWIVGIEAALTETDIANYGNRLGAKDTLQSADDVNAFQRFAFTQVNVALGARWTMEAALSANCFGYEYKHNAPVEEPTYNAVLFETQFMPRVAISYKMTPDAAWRVSTSRGFSPPTVAEIRPSDNAIYSGLQPEWGWNYETGLRMRAMRERLWLDATVFYFKLENAIVRRVNESEAEYFVNAGGTDQFGFELESSTWLLRDKANGWVRSIQMNNAFSFHRFTFTDYVVDSTSFSNNRLTGVPRMNLVSGLDIRFNQNIFLFVQHRHQGKLPLNDANTAFAGAFDLVQLKTGWWKQLGAMRLELFAGVDNLFDATYSLGNDLNAAGQRYYNPAPPRNYYGGIALQF